MDDKDYEKKLKEAALRSADKIEASELFLVLFNDAIRNDPIPLLQMGLAMYMDKPIYLLVPEGCKIPSNLLAVAKRIEYFKRDPKDMSSFEDASRRLFGME